MIHSEEFDNTNPIIQSMMKDIVLYKSTIENLNFTILNIQQSNCLLSNEIETIHKSIDLKIDTIVKFLKKKNYSIEDIEEFENEIKINNDRDST